MQKEHQYSIAIKWTGNKGNGTKSYRSYERSHTVLADGKSPIFCSSDPAFNGDKTKYNPEELLVASLSSCHMLWFLHLCSDAGVVVTEYIDKAQGVMQETENGGGYFKEVLLQPEVTVTEQEMVEKIEAIHKAANERCFIANSVNFPVKHSSTTMVQRKDSTDI